jgi:DNA invertase Pin-like site-specific DNA recombinase
MRDEGVSGFSGRNRSDKAALGAFLSLVRAGEIPRGSYLLVESLDRLSREEAVPALSLLLELIQAGIRVVQLLPSEVVYDERANPMALMMAIMELSRGHSESKMKSERVGRAWANKKRLAASDKVPITRIIPGWLKIVDGKFVVIPERAAVVRRIFHMAADGWGIVAIAQKLTQEEVPPFGRAPYWASSYVAKLLTERRAVGEYQPRRQPGGRHTKRIPDGPPVPGYFPSVVTEEEWAIANRGIESRRHRKGSRGKTVNLFQGLITDARTGSQMHMNTQRANGPAILYPHASVIGTAVHISFPLAPLEQAILATLTEVDPARLAPRPAAGPRKADGLAARLADLSAREEKVKARMMVDEDLDSLADVLRRLRTEREEVAAELKAERDRAEGSDGTAWATARTLIGTLATAEDVIGTRVRLRGLIRQVVSGIWTLAMGRRSIRVIFVQMRFAAGGMRQFTVFSRGERPAGRGVKRYMQPALWWVKLEGPPGKVDLRNAEHVARVEKWLGEVDVTPPSPG